MAADYRRCYLFYSPRDLAGRIPITPLGRSGFKVFANLIYHNSVTKFLVSDPNSSPCVPPCEEDCFDPEFFRIKAILAIGSNQPNQLIELSVKSSKKMLDFLL
jgi:hypothetical protein